MATSRTPKSTSAPRAASAPRPPRADDAAPPLPEQLGRAVRRLRTVAGYSQEGFADAVGLHRTYLSLVERGRVAATITTLEKLAASLGLTASALLAEAESER